MGGLGIIGMCALAAVAAAATGKREAPPARQYPRFFPGVRWGIAYGRYDGIEKFAVDELQRTAQFPHPYVVDVEPAKDVDPKTREHLFIVGTAQDNPLIAELVSSGKLKAPTGSEGYSIACFDSPWKLGQRVVALAGADDRGVLYAVEEYNAQFVKGGPAGTPAEPAVDFARCESPKIANRGIWTWGYVIYDYRRLLDHMARLKMNTLIVWNDVVPHNCRDLIAYAHSRGVRVILGFHWGWGVDHLDPNSAAQRKQIKAEVVANYRENYKDLGLDGIYFQSFTEHSNLTVGNRSTADLVCEWVNDIAQGIFKLSPKLRVEFGLHGTSIRERYVDLKSLDPRIVITWEDVGTLPYTYDPVAPNPTEAKSADPYQSFAATVDYSKKIATFRANREFSIVAKGWIQLPWEAFEHHGPFIIGERDPGFITARLAARQKRWDFVNELWAKNYPLAARFYRDMLGCSLDRMSVTGLVEDGMIEERIQPSVALFAETLWNPFLDDSELLARSQSPYFAGR